MDANESMYARTSDASLTVKRALVSKFSDDDRETMKSIKSILVHMTWQYDVSIEVDHWSYRIQRLDGAVIRGQEEFEDDVIEGHLQVGVAYAEFCTMLGNQPERTKEIMWSNGCAYDPDADAYEEDVQARQYGVPDTGKLDKLAELSKEELFQRPLFRD